MSAGRTAPAVLSLALLCVACGGDTADTVEQPVPAPPPVAAQASEAPQFAEGFESLYSPYDEIGRALSEDRLDTVGDSATQLADAARALAETFSVERAGVSDADADAAREMLPDLAEAAVACAESADIEAARKAFEHVSRLMVSYRDMQIGDAPLVAYCPMVDADWLQSGEEIANPYYGSEMLRCGEIVRR